MHTVGVLLLILIGGPAAMLVPALVARRLVWRHADEYGPVIRAAGRDDADAATVRAIVREVAR